MSAVALSGGTAAGALRLREEDVVKVVPQRIMAAAWHPSTTRLVLACGDKTGSMGVVDVDDASGAPTNPCDPACADNPTITPTTCTPAENVM